MNKLAVTPWRWTLPALLPILAALLCGCAHLKPGPFSFVQMCDPQIGFGGYEADLARFRQAAKQMNSLRPDFVVVCGDLVNKPDANSIKDFNRVKANLDVPCYCVPGNHDVGNAPTPQTLKAYRRLVGKDYFSFAHKGCLFVALDTQLWKAPVAGETEKQEAWMRRTLQTAAREGRPIFVIEHYPPFVKDPGEPDAYFNLPIEKRKELLTEFERYGVVAVLAGHTHTTSANRARGIEVVCSETTSQNFDKRPFGFRLWHVTPGGTFRHEFVPLKQE